MPLIDGEKFACSSCIKGHRVSGCNHVERELHHINPKGRPVKQCEHCRGARKSKSHHAKCDCGDKKDKDKHKDKADPKGHDNRCACHSGGKCICGTIKKEGIDLRLDTSKQTLHDARAKPKLTTTHSEPHLTVFANGHHKPCHRNNNTAHVSGAPYKIPRPHTLHGHSAFASLAMQNNNYGKPDVMEQRSMDTLSLSNNDYYAIYGSSQSVFDALPPTPVSGSLDNTAIQDALFTSQSSTFGQEGNSPSESHVSDTLSNQWPWSAVDMMNRNFMYGSLSTSPSQDCLPNLDSELSIPSAGFNPLWSAGDLPLDPSKLTDSLTQPISHSGESKHSVPGLSTASSSHSEVGEPTLFGDLEFKAPPSAASESLFWEDSPVYRLAASGPSENMTVPVSAPALTSALDLDFAKSLSTVPTAMTSTTSPGDFSETGAIAIPNSLEEVNSNNPWMLDQTNAAFGGLGTYDMGYSNTWL